MTRTLPRAAALLGATLMMAGCAAQSGGGAGAPPTSAGMREAVLPDDGLVLQVSHVGGYVPETVTYSRLPLVTVYADGRVLTEGPVIAIYPGPALPNVQVTQIDRSRVEQLVQRAIDAGVGEDVDYGTPPVTDMPDTRFTVVTAADREITEVYALQRGLFPDGEDIPGLTDEQVAARAELQELLDELTAMGAEATESYVPEAVAAVVSPWVDPGDGLPAQEPLAWPGPPLPGDPLGDLPEVSCVIADGEAAAAVLEAAVTANSQTPWTTDGGTPWSVTLRPLLPHESGCEDLATAG